MRSVCVLAAAALLVGCGGEKPVEKASSLPILHPDENGGTITGKVAFEGDPPGLRRHCIVSKDDKGYYIHDRDGNAVYLDSDRFTPEQKEAAAAVGGFAGGTTLSAMLKDDEDCIRCGLCAARCPTDAMTMEVFYYEERETVR